MCFNQAHDFRRDVHEAVREEGDTHSSSQISRINPGDQWVTDIAVQLPSHPSLPLNEHSDKYIFPCHNLFL